MSAEIKSNALKLLELYKTGKLGGEKMPEDENPCLEISSTENYLYFTLPMALNYQRNSYRLWESANKTYQDNSTNDCFFPEHVANISIDDLRERMLKYKVAVQPNMRSSIEKPAKIPSAVN